jgi:hypothetical protein
MNMDILQRTSPVISNLQKSIQHIRKMDGSRYGRKFPAEKTLDLVQGPQVPHPTLIPHVKTPH